MIGIWLIQLGTPDSPSVSDTRKFLKEFLMDARVIDIPTPLRWCLVQFILLFRGPKSARAYESIWTKEGSPLRTHSENLREKLQLELGGEYLVELGMRYGKPSLESAYESFKKKGVDRIIVLPLYPQYSSASTGSSLEKVFNILKHEANIPAIQVVPPFYADEFFIDSWVQRAKEMDLKKFDHFLFSFHGLPERQIKRSGRKCLEDRSCCEKVTIDNGFCYRAQCVQTANEIAKRLKIEAEQMTICFQSRLGRTPWIQPFTDEILRELPKRGLKRVALFSPSFTADCLETLEEIGIRENASFRAYGGIELALIPSLNSDPIWVKNLALRFRSMR